MEGKGVIKTPSFREALDHLHSALDEAQKICGEIAGVRPSSEVKAEEASSIPLDIIDREIAVLTAVTQDIISDLYRIRERL